MRHRVKKLRILDLFSGIGGFSFGLEGTGGFETVAFCEIEPYCQKVLKKNFPKIPIFNDIKEVTYEILLDICFGIYISKKVSLLHIL